MPFATSLFTGDTHVLTNWYARQLNNWSEKDVAALEAWETGSITANDIVLDTLEGLLIGDDDLAGVIIDDEQDREVADEIYTMINGDPVAAHVFIRRALDAFYARFF